MTDERHPIAQIHAWHDGRLPDEERSAVSAHLAGCAACRSEFNALRVLDSGFHQSGPAELPPDLHATLRLGLDREDARKERAGRRMRWLLAAAAVGAVVLLATTLARRGLEPDWPALAAVAHAELESGGFDLDVRERVPEVLERALRERGATVRVLDLAMMGFQPLGGSVQKVKGQWVAMVAYRNAEGRILLCEMFSGGDIRLPPPLEEHREGGIAFSIYARGGRTVVFWREGSVLCALVGGGSRREVLALAVAKARLP
jgi:anti-sigma factor RsiW